MLLKSVWLFVGLTFSLAAFAYPSVGDRVEMEGQSRAKDGSMIPLSLTKEIISHKKKAKKPWVVREEEKRNGASEVDNEKERVLFTPEQFTELMANCVARQGVVEKINVAAGEFNACKMITEIDSNEKEETWYADVPFGVVKKVESETPKGIKESLELKSFKLGR